MATRLEDHPFHLNAELDNRYPKSAQDNLDDWACGETAYLCKYYPTKG